MYCNYITYSSVFQYKKWSIIYPATYRRCSDTMTMNSVEVEQNYVNSYKYTLQFI